MNVKDQLTKIVSEQLGWPENLEKNKLMIWQNPRHKKIGGLRLTDEGHDILTTQIDLKSYEIDFPKGLTLTNKITIWLDRFIDGPYYITKKSIIVFKEKTAIQLILFSGDVEKFGLAKAMSDKESV